MATGNEYVAFIWFHYGFPGRRVQVEVWILPT